MNLYRILVYIFLFFPILSGLPGPAVAGETQFTEYEVKAAFIYNIAKFVEWPGAKWPSSRTTMPLCIVGDDPFGSVINSINGKTVKGKRVEVRYVSWLRDLRDCQIAFISSSEKDRLPRIAKASKESNTLLIGDTEGYIHHGIILNFYTEGNKVRIEIDLERARQAKLTISSQLLKLARIVGEKR